MKITYKADLDTGKLRRYYQYTKTDEMTVGTRVFKAETIVNFTKRDDGKIYGWYENYWSLDVFRDWPTVRKWLKDRGYT